jgi:L-arabinose isomerase
VAASITDMGQRFRMLATVVDVVKAEHPLPRLPVARAVWRPRPDLRTAAAAWIHAGGSHHTSFGFPVTVEHLRDFAAMCAVEFLVIDETTELESFRDRLRWNDLYHLLAKGI